MDTTVSDGQDLYWWSSQISNTPYPGREWSQDALSKHHAVTERAHAVASEARGVLNDVIAQVLAVVPGPVLASSAAGVPGPLIPSSDAGVLAAFTAGVPGPSPSIVPAAALTLRST